MEEIIVLTSHKSKFPLSWPEIIPPESLVCASERIEGTKYKKIDSKMFLIPAESVAEDFQEWNW